MKAEAFSTYVCIDAASPALVEKHFHLFNCTVDWLTQQPYLTRPLNPFPLETAKSVAFNYKFN